MIIGGSEITELVGVAGRIVLGLVALLRAEPNDIPTVVRELSHWWHRGS
jgi:hypothetical protein